MARFITVSKIAFGLAVLFLGGCAVSSNPLRKEVKLLRRGLIKDDTSYVYWLPYEEDKCYTMIQGYFSAFSHKERAALDFKMRRGSKICAAREGVVVRVKEDSDQGGWNRKYRPFGNNIVIQHPDGSRGGYWHIQKDGAIVNVGDTVRKGQPIALSGKTGYAAFAHLHFLVWDFDKDNKWRQVPTRFQTVRGVKYLKSLRKYRGTHR